MLKLPLAGNNGFPDSGRRRFRPCFTFLAANVFAQRGFDNGRTAMFFTGYLIDLCQ